MASFNLSNAPETPVQVVQPGEIAPAANSAPTHLRTGRAARMGWRALAVGVVALVLWGLFAPLDEGVPAQGIVSIDTKRKAVQHQIGGIVKEVLVREGSVVTEGQLLIRLDDATAKANFEGVRQRYLGLLATQSRLRAEQTGAATMTLHPDLQAASNDPLIQLQIANQKQLFASRRASLKADLQAMEENIRGQESLSVAYEGMLGNRRSQIALLNDELTQTRALVKEGYAPRNRQLELERMVADATASTAELIGNISRSRQAVAESRQRMIGRQQEYRKEVESQLSDAARDALSDAEKFRALQDDLNRTEIKAPASGQVVGLAVQTVGAVISPGQKVMDIVPSDEPVLLETRVQPHLIDRVRADMPVDVRFNAFSHSPQLVVQGKVKSVSGDLLTDQATNTSYYLARVVVTPEGLKKLGKRQMQPGMPVEVVFKTGERTVITYLLHPLIRRVAASMKEE
jgi:membrane fusion protein, protease secretion system